MKASADELQAIIDEAWKPEATKTKASLLKGDVFSHQQIQEKTPLILRVHLSYEHKIKAAVETLQPFLRG